MQTKEQLNERRAALMQELQRAHQIVFRLEGAIALLNEQINTFDTPAETPTPAAQPTRAERRRLRAVKG